MWCGVLSCSDVVVARGAAFCVGCDGVVCGVVFVVDGCAACVL